MADMTAASASPVAAPNAAPGTTEGKGQDTSSFKGTKHKAVIDGVPQEVDYDELVAGYQKGKASDKKFQEAAAKEKAVDQILQGLSSGDPTAWAKFKKLVPKEVFKKVAFDFAYQEMEYDNLPPDKKREMELDERQRKLDEDTQAREQQSKQAQWQSEVKTAGETLQKTLDEFVERSGKKPSSEELYRMSEFMLAHIHKHGKLPSIDQLYDRVTQRMERDALSVIQNRSADVGTMLKWMPPETVKAMKRFFVEEATGQQPRRHQPNNGQAEAPRRRGEPKKVGIDDAFKLLEKKIKGKR